MAYDVQLQQAIASNSNLPTPREVALRRRVEFLVNFYSILADAISDISDASRGQDEPCASSAHSVDTAAGDGTVVP